MLNNKPDLHLLYLHKHRHRLLHGHSVTQSSPTNFVGEWGRGRREAPKEGEERTTALNNGKCSHTSKVAHKAGMYTCFFRIKRQGVFLLPPGWDASQSQGYPTPPPHPRH